MELLETLKDHQKETLNVKWSYKIFNQEKRKIDMTVPKDVVDKEKVLSENLKISR